MVLIKNVKQPKLRTVKQYDQAAKQNQSKLIQVMQNLKIKEPEPSVLIREGGAFASYRAKKAKTFKL